jgi:hypothetical protein
VTTYLRTVCTFPHSTGLPEDAVVNTFSWIGTNGGGRTADAAVITTGLNTFYAAVKSFLSSQYAWNSGTYEYIDMADGQPRIPFKTDSAALGTLSTTNSDMPAEISLCCSYRATPTSGLNSRRRRGRIFLGPLQFGAGDWPVQASVNVDSIATAFSALLTLTNVSLAVYSRYTHHDVPVGDNIADYPDEVPSLLDDAFVPATQVWVDNAWDVQRRRGPKATYRKTI